MPPSSPLNGMVMGRMSPSRNRITTYEDATYLRRTYKTVIAISFGCFAALVSAVYFLLPSLSDYPETCPLGSVSLFCTHCSTPHDSSYNVHTVQSCVIGAFITSLCLQAARIFIGDPRDGPHSAPMESYYATMAVNLMAGVGESYTMLLGKRGRVCTDILGVRIPLLVHIEWLCTVPFLTYIALSIDVKRQFSWLDLGAIAGSFFMILTGFLASLVSDPVVYGLLISLSTGFMFCIYFSLNDAIYHMHLIEISTSIIDQNTGDFFYRKLLARKKRTLVTLLACLFPIFGGTYFLRMAELISAEAQEILFILAGVIAKVGYANLACDAHQEVGSPALAMLEAESNTNKARRAFLRYIFHEIRVPLNSFSMGVELLVDEGPNPTIIETLRESCTLMNSTLNDILSLQKIEEGSMRLVYKSFSLMDMINAVVMDAKDVADSNGVIIEIEVNDAPLPLPSKVFGDKFRLGHVLRSLVLNAIKFGKNGKVAKITLTIDPYNPINLSRGALIPVQEGASNAASDLVIVIIQVIDKGPGIPSQNLERIFEPFLLTRPEDVDVTGTGARGAGVSLAVAKEIVERHQGRIGCVSHVGRGSVFTLTVPMSVVEWGEKRAVGTSKSTSASSLNVGGTHGVLLSGVPQALAADARVEDIKTKVGGGGVCDSGSGIGGISRDAATLASENDFSLVPAKSLAIEQNAEKMLELIHQNEQLFADGVDIIDFICKADLKPVINVRPLIALVVDDVAATRKMLSMMLKPFSIISEVCPDGQKCLDAVRMHQDLDHYDIIFMDNTMPIMTGLEATPELRKLGYNNLICGVTGNSFEAELAEFSASGADIVLGKPLTRSGISALCSYIRCCGPKSVPGVKLTFNDSETLIVRLVK